MTILRVNTIAGIGSTHFGTTLSGNVKFNSQNYVVLPKGTSTQLGVLRNTADVVGTGGTFYDNLVLAMPFNAATGLRDVSSRNRNPGYGGTTNNVGIATTVSKYYGSSVRFDGNGDFISVRGGALGNAEAVGVGTTTGSLDFQFRTGDFTVEFWMNRFDTGTNVGLIDTRPNSLDSNGWFIRFNSTTSIQFTDTGKNYNTSTITPNQWTHIAYSARGGTLFSSVDGVGVSTSLSSKDFTCANFLIGGFVDTQASPNAFGGHLQDLRVYKGLAKYTANFTPPDRIAEVGVGFTAGQLRYNTDSNKPELYDGNQWVQLQISSPNLGISTVPSTVSTASSISVGSAGPRGVFSGGYTPGNIRISTIQYTNISSTGNTLNFGDLAFATSSHTSLSSSTRGVNGGGFGNSANLSVINFITISSTGNSTSFGSLLAARRNLVSLSNATRGIFSGGYAAPISNNIIEYVTISTTGNSNDFGDLSSAREQMGSVASTTRGVFAGGFPAASPFPVQNTIEYITISTVGNVTDFGDLTTARGNTNGGCSNPIRGIFAGGQTPTNVNTIDYITIATLGNAVKFGDLTTVRTPASCASSTRGVFAGGYTPTFSNIIDYVTILTQGNAVDFGDLISPTVRFAACSNAHGGL